MAATKNCLSSLDLCVCAVITLFELHTSNFILLRPSHLQQRPGGLLGIRRIPHLLEDRLGPLQVRAGLFSVANRIPVEGTQVEILIGRGVLVADALGDGQGFAIELQRPGHVALLLVTDG